MHSTASWSRHSASPLNPLVPAAEVRAAAAAAFNRGATSAQVRAEVAALTQLKEHTQQLRELKGERREARPNRRALKKEREEIRGMIERVQTELKPAGAPPTRRVPAPDDPNERWNAHAHAAAHPHAHAAANPPTLELKPPILDPTEIVPAHIRERFRDEYRQSQRAKAELESKAKESERLLAHMALHMDDALPQIGGPARAGRRAGQPAADSRHGAMEEFQPKAPADLKTRRHGADRHRVFSQFVGAQSLSQEGGSPKGRRRIVPPEPPN